MMHFLVKLLFAILAGVTGAVILGGMMQTIPHESSSAVILMAVVGFGTGAIVVAHKYS